MFILFLKGFVVVSLLFVIAVLSLIITIGIILIQFLIKSVNEWDK
jgi:hypothetical protein